MMLIFLRSPGGGRRILVEGKHDWLSIDCRFPHIRIRMATSSGENVSNRSSSYFPLLHDLIASCLLSVLFSSWRKPSLMWEAFPEIFLVFLKIVQHNWQETTLCIVSSNSSFMGKAKLHTYRPYSPKKLVIIIFSLISLVLYKQVM